MGITQASKDWLLGDASQTLALVDGRDDVDESGPWTLTFARVNVKERGAVPAPTPAEAAAGVEPWHRVLSTLCQSTVRLVFGAQGADECIIDYPTTGGVLTVYASSVQAFGVAVPNVIAPPAYFAPVGLVTLARGARDAPRRHWTQTRNVNISISSGIGIAPAPTRAMGYRVVWGAGLVDGNNVPAPLLVEQVAFGTGQTWTDRNIAGGSYYGGAGFGSNLHRDSFVPLVDGATGLIFTTTPTTPAPIPFNVSVQWLMDL